MKDVYVALVEVERLPGCELVSSDVKGGYARCYVLAHDASSAEQAVRQKLAEERLRVVHVEWCAGAFDVEWENPESEEAAECVREARDSGEVVIGRLDTWTDDEDI
jgi:hypothetical protein